MLNKVKPYFPPPKTWVGIAIIGGLGAVAMTKMFPIAIGWVASKLPVIQKSAG